MAAAIALSACAGPIEGPQLRHPPTGFGYQSSVMTGSPTGLGGRRILSARSYMPLPEPHDFIDIVEYEGTSSRADAEAFRDEARRRSRDGSSSELHDARIDFGRAWEWTETGEGRRTLVAVVPEADVTFIVSFSASSPRYQDPAFMRRTVESFVRNGNRTMDVVVTLALLGLAATLWVKRRRLRELWADWLE